MRKKSPKITVKITKMRKNHQNAGKYHQKRGKSQKREKIREK
jgi:hypothetical protein